MTETRFPAYVVRKADDGAIAAAVESLEVADLPESDVLIRVACSSLNYKDALAARGNPGVVRRFPHVPGIDCAGTVVSDRSGRFAAGDRVLVTGYGLGAEAWGGFSQYVRVPVDWVVALPDGLSFEQAMCYGTAGFTAAQAVDAVISHGVDRRRGTVVVTGASGGVGSFSVALLARIGYQVAAVTGKADAHDYLRRLGAERLLARDEVVDTSARPLLSARWSAAVDSVGGGTLATLVRSTMHRGCVAACGLVGGTDLPLTVFPFILRGVRLIGIDSAQCPMPERLKIWDRLAGPWRVDERVGTTRTITLGQLGEAVEQILAGEVTGRILVRPEA